MVEALNTENLAGYAGTFDIVRHERSLKKGNLLFGLSPEEHAQLESLGLNPKNYPEFLKAVTRLTGISPETIKYITYTENILTILPNRDTAKP